MQMHSLWFLNHHNNWPMLWIFSLARWQGNVLCTLSQPFTFWYQLHPPPNPQRLQGVTWEGREVLPHLAELALSLTVMVRTRHWQTQTPAIGKYVLHQWTIASLWTRGLGGHCSSWVLTAKLFLDSCCTWRTMCYSCYIYKETNGMSSIAIKCY